jgi:hypothetical protein
VCDVPPPAVSCRHPADLLDISHGTRGGFPVGSLLARRRWEKPVRLIADSETSLALSLRRVAPSQPKENSHEVCNPTSLAAGRFHRVKYCGSQCRRLRCWCVQGRLRRGRAPRRCGRATSCCRRATSGRAAQGVLIISRRGRRRPAGASEQRA